MSDLLWTFVVFALGCLYGWAMRTMFPRRRAPQTPRWWTTEKLWPAPDVVVVCIDADGLYFAKRTVLFEGEPGEWLECGPDGELTWFLRSRSPNRIPLWWQHLPRPKRGEIWRRSTE